MLSKWFCISINTHPFRKKRCRKEIKHNYTWDHLVTLESTTFSSHLFTARFIVDLVLLLLLLLSNTVVSVHLSFSNSEITEIQLANCMTQTRNSKSTTQASACAAAQTEKKRQEKTRHPPARRLSTKQTHRVEPSHPPQSLGRSPLKDGQHLHVPF